MSLSPLLLLLLVCSSHALHNYGMVITHIPKNNNANGSVQVVLRYKLSFDSCTDVDCGTVQSESLNIVDQESSGEWCQREGVMKRQMNTTTPFVLLLDGGDWINNQNGLTNWSAEAYVDLSTRSDTGQANRSPQTTVLPALRVPSNCQREFNLLAFDPDGDTVQCLDDGVLPSVLSLSPESCSLSFSNTNSSNEGSYIVQMNMLDYPNQDINLTHTNGSQTERNTSQPLSFLPVQFVLKVDAAVPSCTEGLYLPRFLPPTPDNRAQLYTPVHQTLSITINAEANNSIVSELLFSGPHNAEKQNGSAAGQFNLTWTPSEEEAGEDHPICFVVQAVNNLQSNPTKYQSVMRCVIVRVGNGLLPPSTPAPAITTSTPAATPSPTTSSTPPVTETPNTPSTERPGPSYVIGVNMRISSVTPLSDDDTRNAVLQQIKDELVRRGLPADITLRLVRIKQEL